MRQYYIAERRNPLAIHAIFDSLDRAERHLREVIPVYVARGYFTDKTLRAEDFVIAATASK